jgi:hypothetical protein
MLVSESKRRSNPRVLYGILARSALERIADNTAHDKDAIAYFRNLARLLEMYRFNSLRRTAPRAVLERRKADVKSLLRDRAENEAVERALSIAHESVYAGVDREELVQHLKGLLDQVSINGVAQVSATDLEKMRHFLSQFATALKNQ